ncbi:MAG: hypothetical protein KatS3mg110_2451 [Pirellulaceae bacterium]|nr:MAG: hypothetical protein KatS3mg110_2451 [Pirellulaceae bacterium]
MVTSHICAGLTLVLARKASSQARTDGDRGAGVLYYLLSMANWSHVDTVDERIADSELYRPHLPVWYRLRRWHWGARKEVRDAGFARITAFNFEKHAQGGTQEVWPNHVPVPPRIADNGEWLIVWNDQRYRLLSAESILLAVSPVALEGVTRPCRHDSSSAGIMGLITGVFLLWRNLFCRVTAALRGRTATLIWHCVCGFLGRVGQRRISHENTSSRRVGDCG